MVARKIDLDELARLHAEGWHRDELAARFSVAPANITKARRELGLPLDAPRRSAQAGRRQSVDREEFARLQGEGWKAQELAEHFRCSLATVGRLRRLLDVPTHFLTPERVALVESRLDDGWSFNEIHRTDGVDVETLRRRWPGRAWSKAESVDYRRRLRWFQNDLATANYALPFSDLRKSSLVA
jgi:hypothetical protein